jgi:hypothetical protein
MAWDLGASLAFELAPVIRDDPAEKARVKDRGMAFLQTAARLGAGPPWLALTTSTHLLKLGRTEQAVRHLEEMYALVDDEDVRAQIATEIAVLRGEAEAAALEQTVEAFETRRQAELPYLDPGLFLLLDQPPAPTWDDAAWDDTAWDDPAPR